MHRTARRKALIIHPAWFIFATLLAAGFIESRQTKNLPNQSPNTSLETMVLKASLMN
jgi:hypothetical protein